MSLDHELQVYRSLLNDLLDLEGQWIVVSGNDVHGPYGSYGEGLTAGYERHGLSPFLLKKIERIETVHWL